MAFTATAWIPALALFMLFVYWIYDAKLYSKLGFTSKEVITIFLIKCGWCLLNAWLHVQFQNGGDTYDFYQIGAQVHRALFRDPRDFFALVFLPNEWFVTDGLHHYYNSVSTYGNEDSFLLVRLNALFYLVSFGSYPAHLILFSFVTLPGLVMLLRFAYDNVKIDRRWVNGLMLLFPGIALWCNGMHKEALAFSGMGYLLYAVASIRYEGFRLLIIGLVGIGAVHFIARWYMAVLLLPIFLAVYLYRKRFTRKLVGVIVVFGLTVFVALLFISSRYNLHKRLLGKQQAFNKLNDYSERISFNVSDLVGLMPTGFYRTFVSPVPLATNFNWPNVFYFLMNLVVLCVPLLTFRYFNTYRFLKLGIWFIGVAVISLTALGIMVPQIGAVQRYKAPLLAVLVLGWLLSLSVKRFTNVKM